MKSTGHDAWDRQVLVQLFPAQGVALKLERYVFELLLGCSLQQVKSIRTIRAILDSLSMPSARPPIARARSPDIDWV